MIYQRIALTGKVCYLHDKQDALWQNLCHADLYDLLILEEISVLGIHSFIPSQEGSHSKG